MSARPSLVNFGGTVYDIACQYTPYKIYPIGYFLDAPIEYPKEYLIDKISSMEHQSEPKIWQFPVEL